MINSISITPLKRLVRCSFTVVALSALVFASTACTRPQKPTAVGSGVGGTVGAGLGAIIGSQSGNAGGGLVVGALAGAATGALVGNALQAQDERNRAQDETIKRQEQMLVAQRNEIAALRDVRSDLPFDRETSYQKNSMEQASPFANVPRYRYKSTSVDATSPAVERARNKLRQRGPSPRSSIGEMYQPIRQKTARKSTVAPRRTTKTTASVKAPTRSRRSIARFDVRTELNKAPTKTTSGISKTSHVKKSMPKKKSTAVLPSVAVKANTLKTKSTTNANNTLQEKDLVIDAPKRINAPQASSSECRAALKERDKANTAQANSDKLYHLRRALRLCPNSAPLHYALGSVYAKMDRRADAESEYKEALHVDPSFSLAQKALGEILKEEIQF